MATRCDDLEDIGRLKERGFVLMRNVVQPDELAAMRNFVSDVPMPDQVLCGASDVQPRACMVGGEDIAQRWPKLWNWVTELFSGWLQTNVSAEAEIGFPLRITGSEFISINSWPFRQNVSCVLNGVFLVGEQYTEGECLAACDEQTATAAGDISTSQCWLHCMWEAILTKAPVAEIRASLVEAQNSVCRMLAAARCAAC
jgi:hypothetical protein